MNIKIFNGNDLPDELLLATRQTTKLRNAFENNISTDYVNCKIICQLFKRIFRFIIK